ncbi:MAG: hypothetical protein AB1505_03260 [Candidatus Latescibacterota bacterium]
MTPRERVLAALAHRPLDRVPVDFGGNLLEVGQFLFRNDSFFVAMFDAVHSAQPEEAPCRYR